MIKFANIVITLLAASSIAVEGAAEGKIGRLHVDGNNDKPRRLDKGGKIGKVCIDKFLFVGFPYNCFFIL